MNRRLCATVTAGFLAGWMHASPVSAQADEQRRGRVEISAGVGWIGRSSMGARDATLTTGAGDRVRLFSTASDLGATPEVHVRVDDRVAGALDIEASASLSKPSLTTTATADAETASSVGASVQVTQIMLEGGVRIAPASWSVRRTQLFAAGGGGYLRQLYEGRTLVETGRLLYAGGGAAIALRAPRSPRSRRIGLRIDVRAIVFSGGVVVDNSVRVSPSATLSIFASF